MELGAAVDGACLSNGGAVDLVRTLEVVEAHPSDAVGLQPLDKGSHHYRSSADFGFAAGARVLVHVGGVDGEVVEELDGFGSLGR